MKVVGDKEVRAEDWEMGEGAKGRRVGGEMPGGRGMEQGAGRWGMRSGEEGAWGA